MSRTFIGQYEVISRLGAGGMGTVVLARAPDGRLVVIKQPHAGDEQLRELLINEARVGLRLHHPNIVQTVDFFELDGEVSLVLSYVSGVSLQDLRDAGPVPLETICRVGQQISEALDTLHHATDDMTRQLNIVHRDVTPGNIMIGHDGDARLIDLGIAKSDDRTMNETQVGFLRGTIRYLAPEIFVSSRYSPQSDLWALGISLLDAALGRPALPGADPEVFGRVMARRIFELLPGERIDPRLERILKKLLNYEHEKRPQRGKEAAALFSMLAKELGDTKETTCATVRVVAGVAASPQKNSGGSDATELLVEQATNMYVVGDWGFDGDDASNKTVVATGSLPSLPASADGSSRSTSSSPTSSAAFPLAPLSAGPGPSRSANESTANESSENKAAATEPLSVGSAAPEKETEKSAALPPAFGTPAVIQGVAGAAVESTEGSAPVSSSPSGGPIPTQKIEHPRTPSNLTDYLEGLRALEKPDAKLAAATELVHSTGPTRVSNTPPPLVLALAAVASFLFIASFGYLGYAVGTVGIDDSSTKNVDAGTQADSKDVVKDPVAKDPVAKDPVAKDPVPKDVANVDAGNAIANPDKRPRTKTPACYAEGRTKYFWYLNRRGVIVTATRFLDIPRRYRGKVRCAE